MVRVGTPGHVATIFIYFIFIGKFHFISFRPDGAEHISDGLLKARTALNQTDTLRKNACTQLHIHVLRVSRWIYHLSVYYCRQKNKPEGDFHQSVWCT